MTTSVIAGSKKTWQAPQVLSVVRASTAADKSPTYGEVGSFSKSGS